MRALELFAFWAVHNSAQRNMSSVKRGMSNPAQVLCRLSELENISNPEPFGDECFSTSAFVNFSVSENHKTIATSISLS